MANWTNNTFVNALLLGSKWDTNHLNYSFSKQEIAWNSIEKTAFTNALESWSKVADLNFTHVNDSSSTPIHLRESLDIGEPHILGEHDVIEAYTNSFITPYSNTTLEGTYFINNGDWNRNDPNGTLAIGGFSYNTLVHEIGHALGLDHTHSDDTNDPHHFSGVNSSPFDDLGSNRLNQDVFSIMSYIGGNNSGDYSNPNIDQSNNFGYVGGPMAFDIATIQYLYGANASYNQNDTIYVIPDTNTVGTYFNSIWDTGGIDEITYNGDKDITINLHSASLKNETGGGGIISSANGIYGGFTIAADFTNTLANAGTETGVIIENATGGSGHDTIVGNSIDNLIKGNRGNDALYGEGGNDTFIFDSLWGEDTIFDFNNGDKLDFSSHADINQLDDLIISYSRGNTYINSGNNTEAIQLNNTTTLLKNSDFIFNNTPTPPPEINFTDAQNTIIKLYVGYFNRTPEREGFDYWDNIHNSSQSLEYISNQFYDAALQYSTETGYSADMTNTQFIKQLYDGIINRGPSSPQAPTDTEVHYWVDKLNTFAGDKGHLVLQMINEVESYDTTNQPDIQIIQDTFNNKMYISSVLVKNSYTASIAESKTILASVTNTETSVNNILISLGYADEIINSQSLAYSTTTSNNQEPIETIGIQTLEEDDTTIA